VAPALKDADTTPPPSTLITLPEPLLVEASKAPFEENSAFSPFPVIDDNLGKIDLKEDAAKALASKQTGDAKALVQKQEEVVIAKEEKKKTVEYYRKPTLKFAITPIKKVEEKVVEEVKTSSEQPTELPKEEATTELPKEEVKIESSSENPAEKLTQFLTELSTEKSTELPTEMPTVQPIEFPKEETTTGSSSEKTVEPLKSTPLFIQEVEPTTIVETTTSVEITQPTTVKEIKTHHKSIGVTDFEADQKPVETEAESGPVFGERKTKIPKKKIQVKILIIQKLHLFPGHNHLHAPKQKCQDSKSGWLQVRRISALRPSQETRTSCGFGQESGCSKG
jgi:hypothetical protein